MPKRDQFCCWVIGVDISTVSKHLSVLKVMGLVDDAKRGNLVYYRLGCRVSSSPLTASNLCQAETPDHAAEAGPETGNTSSKSLRDDRVVRSPAR